MDVLSEVLRIVRLSGALHFCGEFSSPWAFRTSPPELMAARLKLREGTVTPFHVLVEGSCLVASAELPPVAMEAGDVIIFPRADQHTMASDMSIAPVPISQIYTPSPGPDITWLRYGGGGHRSQFVCGYLHADDRFDPLINSLPAVICVRVRGSTLLLETCDTVGRATHRIDQAQGTEWWQASLRYLIREAISPGPGSRSVIARLAESLFVEVLRMHLHHGSAGHGGWLAGLHDPHVGRALMLLHSKPDKAWTVDELAEEVALSRAAFAKRFADLVGQSPIQYLSCWRMHLARHMLREGSQAIAEISARVGYESEAAFNRAFRRHVGLPPATWRESQEAEASSEFTQ